MLSIRPETPDDIAEIHYVNEAAFGQNLEAEIVDKLRSRGVQSISLVAISDEHVIGHIGFSPVTIKSENNSFQAVGLGPMAVLPEYQRKGIGSQLVQAGLGECRRLGYEIVVLVGHPIYYPRFGFVPAKVNGLICEFDVPEDAWMVIELKEGAPASRQGTVFYQPEFREVT